MQESRKGVLKSAVKFWHELTVYKLYPGHYKIIPLEHEFCMSYECMWNKKCIELIKVYRLISLRKEKKIW